MYCISFRKGSTNVAVKNKIYNFINNISEKYLLPVDPADCLRVVAGVPGGIKHYNSVSPDKVDSQTTRPCRHHEQLHLGGGNTG